MNDLPISYHRAVEIGSGDRYSSQLLNSPEVLRIAARVDLYEPNVLLYEDLEIYTAQMDYVFIHNKAVSDLSYEGTLYTFGYASYLAGSPAFLPLSVEPNSDATHWAALRQPASIVDIKTVEAIGEIDLLVLTCNGSELDILNQMKSRPKMIYTKYYCHNTKHWDYYNQVTTWIRTHGYEPLVLDRNQHATYFFIQWRKAI